MKKIIVTGANGFIGSNLVRFLLEKKNYEVVALIRKSEFMPFSHKKMKIVNADFEDYGNLNKLLPKDDYYAFVHLAWFGYGELTNDYRTQINNVLHACEAAEASAMIGCKKFVLADSFHEYLYNKNSADLGLASIYGSAKFSTRRLCQTICHRNEIEFNGLLISNIFGHGDFSSRTINFFIKSMIEGKDLKLVDGNDLYDWVYIDDAVEEMTLAIENGKNNSVYYIGTENPMTLREILIKCKNCLKSDSQLFFGAFNDNSFVDYTKFSFKNTFLELGYKTKYPLETAVLLHSEWIKENLK